MQMKKLICLVLMSTVLLTAVRAQVKPATDAIAKIKMQGLGNSHVMEIAFQLTDVAGPRLTNSPGYFRAANWARKQLESWGISDAKLEPWGEFGKSWELKKSYIAMTAPYYRPLIGFPKTWTSGTKGPQHAELLLVKATDSASLEAYQGKMKGKLVLLYRTDTLKQSFKADASRRTDEDLEKLAAAPAPVQADTAELRRRREQQLISRAGSALPRRLREMAAKQGAIGLLSMNPQGHDGTVFVQGGGAYGANDPENLLDIVVASEDYNSMARLANSGYPVQLDLDVETRFDNSNLQGYNVVAEMKGTDLKDEIVMIGAHLDSWQAATGATDNAAGSAVMLEVMRILKESGLKPRRTIRIALWSGEEQGLLGSRAYVKQHFADPATMQLKEEQGRVSAYFNLDNGTGKIRGIYLQGNDKLRTLFAEWLQPFNDLGAKTVSLSNTGGTDHLSFDAVGIPGFQFIQDEIEYGTRTHHTNMDSYDHLIGADLSQAATIVASFVYNAATRDEKLPRKQLPVASQ
jgi:carboxypeptidase Q